MPVAEFDQAKSDAFAGEMLIVLNHASVALMTSIGHQVGLFDTMAALPPSTSAQIAAAAGLNERYVREWLGAMVTGQVIDYSPENDTYTLPPEHAAWLTRAAGLNNIAFYGQYIPLLAGVEPGIIASFRNGGGVPYSEYPRFQQLMAEDSATTLDAGLLTKTLPLVPGLIERLERGIKMLDVGCGSGHALNLMAQAFPSSHFTGYDFSSEGIAAGRAEAARNGLSNLTFHVRDVTSLEESSQYDLITAFDAIHDQAQPAQVLRGIARALKPDGTFLMVDIGASSRVNENLDHPLGPFMYTFSVMHCMTVSLAQQGVGLGTMWGEQVARQMLHEAGFSHVEVERIEGDIFNYHYIATKD